MFLFDTVAKQEIKLQLQTFQNSTKVMTLGTSYLKDWSF